MSSLGDVERTAAHSARSDSDVLALVRRGDRLAYVVLYERHVGAARRLARSLLRNHADADDVVSEVFASVLAVIQRGKGPRDGFAAYLMASIRHECHRARRRRHRTHVSTSGDAPAETGARALGVDPFARRDEADALQQALQSLPPSAREVLWRTEVEGQSHQEIAEQTGSTPQAVAAHAMRARRALGGAYLQGHLVHAPADDPVPRACRDTRSRLADLVRGSLGTRWRRRLESHLATCPSCRDARAELERVNRHLRTAPGLPLAGGAVLVEVGLKARFVAWLAASSVPAVAATGLVVVSTVVPLAVTRRGDATDRVASASEPAAEVTITTTAVAPAAVETGADPAPTTATSVTRTRPDEDRPVREGPGATPPPRTAPATTTPTAVMVTSPPDGRDPAEAPAPAGPSSTVPSISLPPVTLPPISVPPISLPPVELPGVTTPVVSLPPVSLPLITVPSVTVPSVSLPPVTITVPAITLPPITLPPITVPPITLPPIGG
jgi:RNA polymerase sigma factor (sigma-70 family)